MTMARDGQGNPLPVAIVLAIVGIFAVALRFHARKQRQVGYGLDDWLCLPALLFTVICCSLIAASSTNSYQMQSDVVRLQKLSFAFIVLQPLALGFSKASILLFYRRVFCGNVFNISSWFLLACVGMWSIAMFLASLLQCAGNTSDFWTRQSTTARCHALPISGTFITFDVILDLAIMLLPIPLVVNLQMPLKRRLLVCLLFFVGGLAIAAGIARLALFGKISRQPPMLLSQVWGVAEVNMKGLNGIALFCPIIEVGVALIAACLPSLQMTIARVGNDIADSPEFAWRHLVRQHTHGEPVATLMSERPAPRPQQKPFIDTVANRSGDDVGKVSWKDIL